MSALDQQQPLLTLVRRSEDATMSATDRRSILYPSGPLSADEHAAPSTDEHGRADASMATHDLTGSTLVASPPARQLAFRDESEVGSPPSKDRAFRQSLAGSTLAGDEKRKSGLKRISAVGQKTRHRFLATKAQIAFLVVSFAQSILILGLVATVYARFNAAKTTATDKFFGVESYLAVFVLSQVYHMALTIDALRSRNVAQVFFIDAFVLSLAVMSILVRFQRGEICTRRLRQLTTAQLGRAFDKDACQNLSCPTGNARDAFNALLPLPIAVTTILFSSTTVIAALSYRLLDDFGWEAFHRVSAEIPVMRAFADLEILQTLLKFNGFFILGLAAQLIILANGRDSVILGLSIASMVIALPFFASIGIVMRREHRTGFLAVIVAELCALGWVVLAIVRILSPSWTWLYGASRDSTAWFTFVTLVVLCATMAFTIKVRLNFGRGLAAALREGDEHRDASLARLSYAASEADQREVTDSKSFGSSNKSSAQMPPPRMAID